MNRALFFRNVVSQFARHLVPIVISLYLTKFMLDRLGGEAYGVFFLAVSLVAFFTLVDLGIEATVSRYVAAYHGKTDEKLGSFIGAALVVAAAVGALGFIVSVLLAGRAVATDKIPDSLRFAAQWLIILNGAAFMFSKPAAILGAALQGFKRFDISSAIALGWAALYAVGVWAALRMDSPPWFANRLSFGLIAVGVIGAAGGVLNLVFGLWFLKRTAPTLKLRVHFPKMKDFGEEVRFALWTSVDGVAGKILVESNAVIIGYVLIPLAVTPFMLGARIPMFLFAAIYQAVWVLLPYFTSAAVEANAHAQRAYFLLGLKYLLAVVVPPLLFAGVFAGPILDAWLGPGDSERTTVMQIYCIVALAWCLDGLPVVLLYSIGRVKQVALTFLAEAGAKLALSFALLNAWGIAGVAVGTVAPACVVFGFVLMPWTCRRLGISVADLWRVSLRPHALPLAAFAGVVAAYMFLRQGAWTMPGLAGAGIFAGAAYAALFWFLGMNRDERRFQFPNIAADARELAAEAVSVTPPTPDGKIPHEL